MNDEQRQQALVTFLTTEHFTLQGARSAAVAESNSRLQIYMGVVSMTVLALALVAQISRLGQAFFAFALVLLPAAYVFGLMTVGRLRQSWVEWFLATQGMNRIRRYFVEVAPDAERYLSMPTTDEPWATLGGVAIRRGGALAGLVTAEAVVGFIDSMIAGVFGALVALRLSDNGVAAMISGALLFGVSIAAMVVSGQRGFTRDMAFAEVRFPPEES